MVSKVINENTKKYIIKSRNYSAKGIDIFLEIFIDNPELLAAKLNDIPEITSFSILEYNYDDII